MLTLGERGSLWFDGEARRMKSVKYDGPVDFCGAGDTFLSAFACCLGGGADAGDAAVLGNLASSITIQKLGMTGTATREELLEAYNQ